MPIAFCLLFYELLLCGTLFCSFLLEKESLSKKSTAHFKEMIVFLQLLERPAENDSFCQRYGNLEMYNSALHS